MTNIKSVDIFNRIKEILVEDFEANANEITMETSLAEDLDMDSIDAVDLAVRLQEFTQKKISPEEFKQIRTIEHVVLAVEKLLQD